MADYTGGTKLCALFVDFDNVYLSLKSKSELAAVRFVSDPATWLEQIATGALFNLTRSGARAAAHDTPPRRLIINRCYGNPVARNDDRNGFPWVRSHFVRAGFEVIDCPPLTNQMKNSADIRMVMDIRDLMAHEPKIDEFIILSGDADFVPVLHRLRAHNRHSVIFANTQTAAAYEALCDGMVTVNELADFLLDGRLPSSESAPRAPKEGGNSDAAMVQPDSASIADEIMNEVARVVRACNQPVPIEQLATGARNALGLKKTVDTRWAGYGQFLALLQAHLPDDLALNDAAPYVAYDKARHQPPTDNVDTEQTGKALPGDAEEEAEAGLQTGQYDSAAADPGDDAREGESNDEVAAETVLAPKARNDNTALADQPAAQAAETASRPVTAANEDPARLKDVIVRVIETTGVPPLPAPYFHALFAYLTREINDNGFIFSGTAANVVARAAADEVELAASHVQYALDAIRHAGHWFERSDSADILARKFRDYILAKCLSAGITLNGAELDLIDSWFIPEAAPADGADEDKSADTANTLISAAE